MIGLTGAFDPGTVGRNAASNDAYARTACHSTKVK